MSLIKDLRTNPNYQINFLDFVDLFLGEQKSKYKELFLRIFEKGIEKEYSKNLSEAKELLVSLYPEKKTDIENLSTFNLIIISYLFDVINELKINLNILNNFIEYNERHLIVKNDITTYNIFNEIVDQVSIAELKIKEKELEKEIVKIKETDEWVMIKPLTYEASVKYGYGTKWCTAMDSDKSYFEKYTYDGVLIYFINKVTGNKVAVHRKIYDCMHKELSEPVNSFWTQTDQEIDSFDSGLPFEFLDELRNHFKLHPYSNNEVSKFIDRENPEPKKLNK